MPINPKDNRPILSFEKAKDFLKETTQQAKEALTATTFAQYQKHIQPQAGESRWMEIPWFIDLHAARQKAAAEGKPLFIYSSGGATGIGSC